MNDMHALFQHDQVVLVPQKGLLPHERHDPNRARDLAAEIDTCGLWTKPLLIERQHLIILDGHHRWEAAKYLELAAIPAVLISYGDPRLSLSSWRPKERWTPQDVITCALTGNLCPIKTTRHTLRPASVTIAVTLADLPRESGFRRNR